LRILIFKSNQRARDLLIQRLTDWNARVEIAASSAKLVERLKESRAEDCSFDVVLVSQELSSDDLRKVMEVVQRANNKPPTRVVVLSPLSRALNQAALRPLGEIEVVTKPIRTARLLRSLTGLQREGTKKNDLGAEARLDDDKLAPLRVLVAEDNMVNQRVTKGQLKSLGCTVDVVANGYEALSALPRIEYDVVLMDCQMPELDGYETTRAIRRSEQNPAARWPWKRPAYIIALTANAMEGDRERCLGAGMNDYISKPLRVAELRVALQRGATQRAQMS
jgi:CheY-like chemotaxis protein